MTRTPFVVLLKFSAPRVTLWALLFQGLNDDLGALRSLIWIFLQAPCADVSKAVACVSDG